jgi:acid phosphatase class B
MALFPALMLSFGAQAAATSNASAKIQVPCTTEDRLSPVRLMLTSHEGGFTAAATSWASEIFKAENLRPSLSARVHDGPLKSVAEFIEFDKQILKNAPVDEKERLEIDLGASPASVHYVSEERRLNFFCRVQPKRLLRQLGLRFIERPEAGHIKAVGFDIDDTLLASAPPFARAFATGGLPVPSNALFWGIVNSCDPGCPAASITLEDGSTKFLPSTEPSAPKSKAIDLIKYHQSLGHQVYAITARPEINGDVLRDYLEKVVGLPRENVFFEPDLDLPGNPRGKTDRIESLDLDVFYGDSDSDVTDALSAFVDKVTGVRTKTVVPIRFLRAPQSPLRKEGRLMKYHPGYYGEAIIRESYY